MSNPTLPAPIDWPPETRYLRFGEFRLDLADARLLRGEEVVELPARAFDVLRLMVHSPHRLLTRDAIFQAVWKDQIVEDANLTQTIWMLRRALGDEDKRCIRTVARRGYVFAPEEPIQAEAAASVERPLVQPAPQEAPPATVSPTVAAVRSRRRWLAWPAAAIAFGAIAFGAWHAFPAAPPTSVVIVDTVESPDDEIAVASLDLAREWLRWKLSTLRMIDIAGAGAVPADQVEARRVVLLSSQHTSNGWQLDAQIFGGVRTVHLRRSGTTRDIAAGVDAIARDVTAAVTDEADRDAPLDLAANAATAYVEALHAAKHGDRRGNIDALRRALDATPSSAWLRMQLADALAELGQIHAAADVAEKDTRWLDALPVAAREAWQARWLAVTENTVAAEKAYADLVARYPHSASLRLAMARALNSNQQVRRAIEVLRRLDPSTLPTELRLEWLQQHLIYDQYFVSVQAARNTLGEIVEAAGDTPRFALQKVLAEGNDQVFALRSRGTPVDADELAALEAIALRTAAAGSPLGAAQLRLDAATLPGGGGDVAVEKRAAEMLGIARADGDVVGEFTALAIAGLAYGRAGEMARRHATFVEFEAVAQDNQHRPGLRDAQKFLGYDAVSAGRYDEAQRRLEGVLAELPSPQVRQSLVALYTAQGRYDDIDRVIADTNASLTVAGMPPGTSPAAAFGADCWSGQAQLARGRLAEAHMRFAACAAQQQPEFALAGAIGVAQVALSSGNTEPARASALALVSRLGDVRDVPARARLAVWMAQLLADLDEREAANEVLAGQVEFAHANGLAPLEARARAVSMRIALGEGDLERARSEYAAAMAAAPDTDWRARSRLRLLHAALAGREGDTAAMRAEAAAVAQEARALGDVLAELAAVSLGEPGEHERELIARTGARGDLLRKLARRAN